MSRVFHPRLAMFSSSILVCVLLLHLGDCVEREMTVEVGPGKEECFFDTVEPGNTLNVEWQVVDGGDGQMSELDLNFRVIHPRGHPIEAVFKRSDGTFSQKMKDLGDYKICFDNTFSLLSSKTVYFEIINENEDEDYDDLAGIFEDVTESEVYDIKVVDIEQSIAKIKKDIAKAKHMQDMIRVTDMKDRSIMEHNFERVNTMSIVYLVVLIACGLIQVTLLRSLFDEKSRIHGVWKKAFKD